MLLLMVFSAMLAVAVAVFLTMWARQWRRRRMLAHKALLVNLRFSGDDLFDLPRRYAEISLMGSGHSMVAENVTYGHVESESVRMFDLHYEVGHGTRRLTRRYIAAVIEADRPPAELLVWQPTPDWTLPLDGDGRLDAWSYVGSRDAAQATLDAGLSGLAEGSCFQARGKVLLLGMSVRRYSEDASGTLSVLKRIAKALEPAGGRPVENAGNSASLSAPTPNAVAKPATA